MEPRIRVRLRVMHGEEIALGPGKTDLLAAIERVGSISGAAQLGSSPLGKWARPFLGIPQFSL